MSTIVGIDAGYTLTKLTALRGSALETHFVPTGAIDDAATWVSAHQPTTIGATGGAAGAHGAAIDRCRITVVSEFDAWVRGVRTIAEVDGLDLPPRHLLVSLGTGTSILLVEPNGGRRLGGTALGGGTIMGLGALLLDGSGFAAVADRAARGDRLRVDLAIGDVYADTRDGPIGTATAANFGKLASREPDDIAHALVGLVGENVAMFAGAHARAHGVDSIVYCGTALSRSPALVTVVRTYTELFGHHAHFPPHGAHCGAVGAGMLATAS